MNLRRINSFDFSVNGGYMSIGNNRGAANLFRYNQQNLPQKILHDQNVLFVFQVKALWKLLNLSCPNKFFLMSYHLKTEFVKFST